MDASPNSHRAALDQYRRRASVYDAELAAFEPIRRSAIVRLGLKAGDTVIDAGCGTGLSLPLLRDAVGPKGHLIGIEQCPEMMFHARRRVEEYDWRNVTLIETSVEDAPIEAQADAAFFHFTHDILREPRAIARVENHLRPGAHIVATGLQWSSPWLWPVNLFVLGAALYSVSSLAGLTHPWSLLGPHLENLRVDSAIAGAVFVASGTLREVH